MSQAPSPLDSPAPRGHFVQLYNHDTIPLIRNVARYLSDGLIRDGGAIVIVTAAHLQPLIAGLDGLNVDTSRAVRESRLVLLDAASTLAEFIVNGKPDRVRFEQVLQAAMRRVRESGPAGLRAYGEMVGVLWTRQEFSAAVHLENLWNNLLEAEGFSLYCSYPIDIFSRDFQISTMDTLLCNHTHLLPTGNEEVLQNALNRAMDELLGDQAPAMKSLIKANYRPAWAALPVAEAVILWLRNNLPGRADDILALARRYYHESAAVPAV